MPALYVFDAYGTLFDVHAAVNRHAGKIGPDAARFSQVWRAKQLEYSWVLGLCGRYEPFWRLTERALDYAFESFPAVDPSLRASLLDAYRALDAYPEAPAALERLRAGGAMTAVLSNGDAAMLNDAVTSAGLGPLLDAALSVEEAGVFKTHPRAYALVTERFGVNAGEIAFVSSNRWDVAGAAAFGFAAIWLNRAGAPDEYRDLAPRRVIATLQEL
ncbi:MAG: haloacid dehalogenase type II [Salinarimonadaceae bacterium]|nr:MAG: haloacid dehalogenase type II [Salinarimonadaceae bacterium]